MLPLNSLIHKISDKSSRRQFKQNKMPQSKKSIAVCLRSFNQRDYLIQAINSLLAQTRMPDQIVVVDDNSPDDSVEVLRQYERDHPGLFTIKVNETNQGGEVNRHLAMIESRCELTTLLDADDLYYPEKIRLEEQCLQDHPEAGFVYSNFDMIDAQSNIIRPWTTRPDKLPIGEIIEPVVAHNFPGNIHFRFPLTNTAALIQASEHSQSLPLYEDLAIYIQLACAMQCAVVPQINHGYRQHEGGMHRTHRDQHYIALERVYTDLEHLFDEQPPQRRKRIHRQINRVLSGYAWRAIKDHSKSPTDLSKKRVIQLANDAMHQRPTSLRPKHVVRILATQLKSTG